MTACTYVVADVRDALAAIPDGTVDLIFTSFPFFLLRSYLPDDHPMKHLEIGQESDPATFLDTNLGLTAEFRRVLAPHGTLAVEFGDTFAGSGGAGGDYSDGGLKDGQPGFTGSGRALRGSGPLPKSLLLVPEAYRIALAYGRNPLTGSESPAGQWRVRNVVRWVRPNPPVGALGDKFRPATSDLVIACTSRTRWFDLDAVRTPYSEKTNARTAKGVDQIEHTGKSGDEERGGNWGSLAERNNEAAGAPPLDWWDEIEAIAAGAPSGLSPRDLARHVRAALEASHGPDDAWEISPGGYRGSHYAVFPPELCRRPIEAMCPRRVCRTCGEPSRRIAEGTRWSDGGPTERDRQGRGRKVRDAERLADTGGGRHADRTAQPTTTGWTTCGCPGTDGLRLDGWHRGTGWRPGRVLDPFGGTGTTGLVATGLGREALLIDLDERNLDLARERLGMLLTEVKVGDLGAAA